MREPRTTARCRAALNRHLPPGHRHPHRSCCSYVLLALIALDSIIAYRVETRQERAQKRVLEQKAHEEWLAQEAAHGSGDSASGTPGEQADTLPTKQPHEPVQAEQQPAGGSSGANGHAGGGARRSWLHRLACCGSAARSGIDRAGAALHPHRSPQQDAWLALRIDRCALALLLLGYCVTIILIFTLQSGCVARPVLRAPCLVPMPPRLEGLCAARGWAGSAGIAALAHPAQPTLPISHHHCIPPPSTRPATGMLISLVAPRALPALACCARRAAHRRRPTQHAAPLGRWLTRLCPRAHVCFCLYYLLLAAIPLHTSPYHP